MKPNTQYQKDVRKVIKREPSSTAAQVEVTPANRVMTLTGKVAFYTQKWAARRVEGVKSLAEEITVKPSGD